MHEEYVSPGLRLETENMAEPASLSVRTTVPAVGGLPEFAVIAVNVAFVELSTSATLSAPPATITSPLCRRRSHANRRGRRAEATDQGRRMPATSSARA